MNDEGQPDYAYVWLPEPLSRILGPVLDHLNHGTQLSILNDLNEIARQPDAPGLLHWPWAGDSQNEFLAVISGDLVIRYRVLKGQGFLAVLNVLEDLKL